MLIKSEQTLMFLPMKDNGNGVGHCYIKCYTDKKGRGPPMDDPTFAGSVTGKC